MSALPPAGSVLGIDVGFSPVRRSSAVCRLDWTPDRASWTIDRFRYDPDERRRVIAAVAGSAELSAVAIDGPLGPGLVPPGRYRMAERMLTVGFGSLIGKPGASNAPIGLRLATAACEAAEVALEVARIRAAAHPRPVHDQAIVEAFPSAFLGTLLPEPRLVPARRADRSDVYYAALAIDGTLARLISRVLPGRAVEDLARVRDHDDRAALVCALTALQVAAGDFIAVGDAAGQIILPPPALVQPWARDLLAANVAKCGGEVRGL